MILKLAVDAHAQIIFFGTAHENFLVLLEIDVDQVRLEELNLNRLRQLPQVIEIALDLYALVFHGVFGELSRDEVFDTRIFPLKRLVNLFAVIVVVINLA